MLGESQSLYEAECHQDSVVRSQTGDSEGRGRVRVLVPAKMGSVIHSAIDTGYWVLTMTAIRQRGKCRSAINVEGAPLGARTDRAMM